MSISARINGLMASMLASVCWMIVSRISLSAAASNSVPWVADVAGADCLDGCCDCVATFRLQFVTCRCDQRARFGELRQKGILRGLLLPARLSIHHGLFELRLADADRREQLCL